MVRRSKLSVAVSEPGKPYDPVLTSPQIAQLTISADIQPFDADARLFRLGIEAHRLAIRCSMSLAKCLSNLLEKLFREMYARQTDEH
ncbi:MAG: hypothetical protein WKF77_01740 [Planctomycetaceae bacterium]